MRLVEPTPQPRPKGLTAFVRAEDLVWLLLFSLLAAFSPDINYSVYGPLLLLAVLQVAEPRLKIFASKRGQVAAIVVKLALCYVVIGYSHGIASNYYLILLLPIVSAATRLEVMGTLAFILLAIAAYLSFLAFVPWGELFLPADQIKILCLRLVFFPVVGFVVYLQARAKREEMERTELAAAQLAESNSNLRRAQVSLRRSERLAALGQLTAGLAHELRNPLGTIKGSAELLEKQSTLEKPELVRELSGYITSEVDRTNGLIARFLDFARPLEVHLRRADVVAPARAVLAQMRDKAAARNVRLEDALPEGPVECACDADLLPLALTNLIQNAVDASADGQTVRVSLERGEGQVALRVTDRGSGIAAAHLENIFNPFFTTKSGGVGLGLAIVSKIADEHRGKISVTSTPQDGTTFEMVLPCEEDT